SGILNRARVPASAQSMKASAQVTAGAITSMIVAVSTRPNRQNRSTCSRMSVPLVQKQKLGVVNERDEGCCRLLRARRERPRGRRAAEQRDELAPFHYPMPPVLPTERIAHLGTADCMAQP